MASGSKYMPTRPDKGPCEPTTAALSAPDRACSKGGRARNARYTAEAQGLGPGVFEWLWSHEKPRAPWKMRI